MTGSKPLTGPLRGSEPGGQLLRSQTRVHSFPHECLNQFPLCDTHLATSSPAMENFSAERVSRSYARRAVPHLL